MMIACAHLHKQKYGRDKQGNQRYRCALCGKRFTEERPKPLGDMRLPADKAKLVLRLLAEGSSIRSAERITRVGRNTICRLLVYFGEACQRFLDQRMRGLKLDHLECDEQWTYVAKKQSRLTLTEREESSSQGDIYLWTAVDQTTRLMPAFLVGKRSGERP